jgi:hypothetical protein
LLSALGISHYVEARKGRAWVIVLENRQQVEAVTPNISAMTPGEHKVAVTARGKGNTILSAAFSRRALPSGKIPSPVHRTPCLSHTGAKTGENLAVRPPDISPRR